MLTIKKLPCWINSADNFHDDYVNEDDDNDNDDDDDDDSLIKPV